MLTPVEIAALVTATKGAIDIFDKIAGQIKSVLIPKRLAEAEAKDQRWRYKVVTDDAKNNDIVVKEGDEIRQTIKGEDLAKVLSPRDLSLIETYEQKMEEYYDLWRSVYAEKDSSSDASVNAKTDMQLKKLVSKMRGELLGILGFLQRIGVQLDDHYMHVRDLVERVP